MFKLDTWLISGLALVLVAGPVAAGGTPMQAKRLTTVVLVEDVDACAAFYVERLDFQQTMAVPAQQEGATGNQFVALTNGSHELMLQSFASAEDELPGVFGQGRPPGFLLYLEVPDLDAAIARMEGLEPEVSRRETFYGSHEVGYRDPGGTLVILAWFPEAP